MSIFPLCTILHFVGKSQSNLYTSFTCSILFVFMYYIRQMIITIAVPLLAVPPAAANKISSVCFTIWMKRKSWARTSFAFKINYLSAEWERGRGRPTTTPRPAQHSSSSTQPNVEYAVCRARNYFYLAFHFFHNFPTVCDLIYSFFVLFCFLYFFVVDPSSGEYMPKSIYFTENTAHSLLLCPQM